jgi:L-arabinonolactonase
VSEAAQASLIMLRNAAMTSNIEIKIVSQSRDRVGESPIWDEQDQALYWVDGVGAFLRRYDPIDGSETSWRLPDAVGSIALAEPGHLLVALRDGFYQFDLTTGEAKPIARLETDDPGVRFNDGRMDRKGRFICGTMRLEERTPAPGKLYRLHDTGQVDLLRSEIGISNATCFSPDGATLYFADSLQGEIGSFPYDQASGTLGQRSVFANTRDLVGSGPDGAVTDAQGGLWVALPQSGRIARFRPDGALDFQIEAPSPHPSCPAFGGPGLDVLYVTSISDSGPRLRTDHPQAGQLVAITGLGFRGVPEPRFALSNLPVSGGSGQERFGRVSG